MKRSMLVLVFCLCSTAGQAKVEKWPVSDGWQPNEKMELHSGYPADRWPEHEKHPRRGTTPDGLKYVYYSDGYGSIGSIVGSGPYWRVNCRADAMTDERMCSVSSHRTNLSFLFDSGNNINFVCVNGHDYPDRKAMVRIDGGAATESLADGCLVAAPLLPLLVDGAVVRTRHYEWPYDRAIDEEAALESVGDALSLARFIFRKVEALSFYPPS